MLRQAWSDVFSGGCSSVGRVPDCDSGCRGFEPHQPPHYCCLLVSSAFSRVRAVQSQLCGSGEIGRRTRFRFWRPRRESSSLSFRTIIDRRIDWVRAFVSLSKTKRPVTDGPFCIRLPARGQLIGEDGSVGSRPTRHRSRCHHGNLSLHPLRCGLPVLVADGHAAFVILFSFLFSLFSFLFSLFSFLFSGFCMICRNSSGRSGLTAPRWFAGAKCLMAIDNCS